MYGDPASITRLAAAMQTAAGSVSQGASTAGWAVSLMVPSGWSGPAANAFVSHWNGEQTQMSALSMASATMAGTLNRLATALQQANQVAATGTTVQALTTAATNPYAQQAYALAQAAWAQAMSELSGMTVPAIGPTTSPQQAQAWATAAAAAPIPVTSLQFQDTSGTNDPWRNRQPPFPPLFPSMNVGGFQIDTQQPQPVLGPFPGSGWLALQPNLQANGGIAIRGGGQSIGGSSGIDWKALLAALAAAGAVAGGAAAAAALFSKRSKIWQEILVGIALGGRLLGGAHDPNNATPIQQLLDKLGGSAPPAQKAPKQRTPGNNNAGGDPPPDGEWHQMPDGSWEKRLPDGSVIRLGPPPGP
jgi:uncharacterized protein YukE